MHLFPSQTSRLLNKYSALVLLLACHASLAQTVNLTAAATSTTLPDGQTVPMWGYQCADPGANGATCAAANTTAGGSWSPVVITVPYNSAGTSLTINLTNNLNFTTSSGTNSIPTSLVIVGQLGGGLGGGGTTTASPTHTGQAVTWPTIDPNNVSTPPAQLPRVQSFGTEVLAGNTSALTWSHLRPGTYLIESGTHPSIQAPMGLYGVLVVTAPGQAYPAVNGAPASAAASIYDADLPVVLSEIDPVQNAAVDTAVRTSGFSETAVWSALASPVLALNVTNGGSGYTSTPTVKLSGGGGTGATATATVLNGAVSALTIGNPGAGYTTAPTVSFSGGGATVGASAAASINSSCGNSASATANTCYPPAVNYSPRYYLINGVSFDRTNLPASTVNVLPLSNGSAPVANTGNVLVRLVNAGLRMHVPSIVNMPMTLIAEDGNTLPGVPRIQNEVFLAAGKTYDVVVKPLTASPPPAAPYAAVTYPIFDRQLSLSTNNQRDGGMQAYIAVAGGAASGVGTTVNGSSVQLTGAGPKTFYCVAGAALSVTDPARGLLGGTTGANGVALKSSALVGDSTLTVQSNGTFTYTPPSVAPVSGAACGGSFTYLINTTSVTSTIVQCDATTASNAASGCSVGGAPTLANDSFNGNNAKVLKVNPPGVLLNDVDPSGLPLVVDTSTITPTSGTLTSLIVNADGSISAVAPGPGTYQFSYNVKNSQGTAAASTATVTLTFPQGSGLVVNLVDQKVPTRTITDYRWIIEEDRTFWIDPKCQVSTGTAARPMDSYGRTCPPTPVEALGYNFHTAAMPVVATGCVGSVSCESGQTVLSQPAVCDGGDGTCRTTDAAGNPLDQVSAARTPLDPRDVYLDPKKHYFISVMPGDGINPTVAAFSGDPGDPVAGCPSDADFVAGSGKCGHNMGGAQIAPQAATASSRPPVTIKLAQTPLPTAKIAVLVYQDDYPLNGENDAGGGVDILAPNEAGLGGFQIELLDQAGGLGDSTGQITYDMFNMPVSNALAGTIDPMTNQDACPLTSNSDGIVGMIVTCPTYEKDGKTMSPLAGQAVIQNLYPGLYEIQAFPAADRVARGEEWLQTNTLDGGKPHEAFIRPGEPAYFQEFGPGGFHVQIGFANPKIINDRRHNGAGTGLCDSTVTGGGGLTCNSSITGQVHGNHMSRTPDQRTYDTGTYDAFAFSQCYVSLGVPDQQDFAFAKCDADGNFSLTGLPDGVYKLAVFDQWNDIMLDGLITSVTVSGNTVVNPTATQWRTNLYTRTYLDLNGNGIPDRDASGNDLEPGTVLLPIVVRYRDGSIGFQNNTDLNGYATYNEVFPFMNWLVVEPDQTRYKPTGEHVVYDAGGPDDCSAASYAANGNCSNTAAHLAGTVETNSVPLALRVPGAVYCTDADCSDPAESVLKGAYYTKSADTSKNASNNTGLSSGRIDPPWRSEGWQGLLGQHSFIDFGMKPYAPTETGPIQGLVIYASTRPFDDPTLDVQLIWEPAVPNVQVNLYQEGTAADGTKTLTLVDTTVTSSWDKWAQGFQTDGHGNLRTLADGSYVPNMNCPGQDPTSGFFATLQGSKMWLDTADSTGNKKTLAYNSQFKCYDGWSQLNQIQPAPYDGKYSFPSVVDRNPVTGRPSGTGSLNGNPTPLAGTNCTICVANPDDGTPMLPPGKYVVEVVTPPGFEIVKEEDKNILMGDIYIAPVTQQFAGLGNVFILPDQAAMNAYYNANNPVNSTNSLGVVNPREDFATTDQMWPCVGKTRIVPDTMSLFPAVGQTAPFAGASRPLCDRKEVSLVPQQAVSARFYVFTKNHIAGHFVGGMTNDMASEFDPFSPQFGEKFGVPNLPVRMRDFVGDEVTRVYGDQWGAYNGLYFSSWEVNPPNPTGYAPQMSVACMNDPGPIADPSGATNADGSPVMITDPAYNPAYANFCYETPFMPGFTAYMDTPVTPVQAFADHYNLPDAEYPDGTPVIKRADFKGNGLGAGGAGPWSAGTAGVASVAVAVNSGGRYATVPTVGLTGGGGTGAAATALAGVGRVTVVSMAGSYTNVATPTVTFSAPPCTINGTTCVQATGTAQMSGNNLGNLSRRVTGINLSAGSGYTSAPTVTFSPGPATATTTLGVKTVTVTAPGTGYTSAPSVTFTAGLGGNTASGTATLAGATASLPLYLTAYGDRPVQNPQYAGPSAISFPYNAKTVIRHYGFGSYCASTDVGVTAGCVVASSVTVGGKPAIVNPSDWTDSQIKFSVPALAPCLVQQQGAPPASCGEVVITSGNGKQSIDGISVTVGGNTPKYVSPSSPSKAIFGEFYSNPLQTAIDAAKPGDLLIVDAGTYRENLIVWKPVRLQGVGAGAVTINADAQPAGKMDAWRRRVSCHFGLTIQGVPNAGNSAYDPSGQFTCPTDMYFRADRMPFEGFVGWDASSNGNLAQVLQEPSLMGAYEGAGITVIGRGINQKGSGNSDLWGQTGGAGTYPNGSVYVSLSDCSGTATSGVDDYKTSNYLCNPSAIDGFSIINSSQGGGGVYLHGWNHNMQIGNNRISANAGTLSGAINLGTGETPPAFTIDNTICGNTGAIPAPLCPPQTPNSMLPNVPQTILNAQLPFQFNTNVHIHHNQILDNASIGDALFSGSPAGAGGVTISAGSDNYELDHNWIAANLTSSDGGGVAHMGVSFNGSIHNNFVLFNQANNPTLPVDGGGIVIMGAQEDRTLPNGQECGGTTDIDCPPGMGDGTGPGLVIDSNLMLGNSAEDGSGGGLRLRQTNGTEVAAFPSAPGNWYGILVTNNIIVNNVAGWDGGGVSLQDSFKTQFVNNTVASNDTTASAGVLFKTLGAINAASPPPGCIPTPDPTQPQAANCLLTNGPHIPQPAGLVTMQNTPNMTAQFSGINVTCPAGFGYGSGSDATGDASLTNGRCLLVSLPQISNDLFWQNRAFHVEIVDQNGNTITGNSSANGSGILSHQNIVALKPLLNQTYTGQCVAPPSSEELYWDVGVRMDALPNSNGHNLIFKGAAQGGSGGTVALATATIDAVNALNLTSGGSGYTAAPTVTFTSTDGNGAGAAATAVITGGVVTAINLTSGGSGYTAAPTVAFISADGNGSGASGTASVPVGTLSSITVTSPGSGYSSAPTVQISGGGGSAAAASAVLTNGQVSAINVTNPGTGYTSAPTVTLVGGITFGSGAGPIALRAINSIFSDAENSGNVLGTPPVQYPVATPVMGQYCNGARIPPEQCATGQGANNPGMCKGYFTPAGQSETVGVAPVFLFNSITASATVDEGNNWINMTYGPLTLGRPTVATPSAEPTVASAAVGTVSGAYSIAGNSAAVGAGIASAPGAPGQDFYGQKRPTTAVSIGAVEYIPPPPTLVTISPTTGAVGTTVAVTLTGTNFTAGSTVSVAGGGVTVNGVAQVSATQLTANFVIASTATLGGRAVSVTTSGGTSNTVTFTLANPPPPVVTAIAPASGAIPGTGNSSVPVTLTGSNFTTGSTVGVSGTGVTVSNVVVVSPTQITATFTISSAAAAAGSVNVTVTTPGGTSSPVAFGLIGHPTLTSIAPTNGAAGTTVPVTLTGTNLTGATAVTVSGGGITVSGLTVVNSTTVTASFAITNGATRNGRNVTITTPGGTSNAVTFTVIAPAAPVLSSVAPNSGLRGTSVAVTLTGTNLTGATAVAVPGGGVACTAPVVAAGGTSATATCTITVGAALGSRNMTITTPGGTSNAVAFTVTAPTLTGISPNSGGRGTPPMVVTLTGTNLTGANAVTVSGGGITVSGLTVVNSTTVTATFTITSVATRGGRNVRVSTPGGTSNPVTFTVN